MKRRIFKFRAWNTISEEMLNFEHLASKVIAELATPTELIFMQFTGLIDSKGKEIYEGDIFRETVQVEPDRDFDEYYICTWINEFSCFVWLNQFEYVDYVEYPEMVVQSLIDSAMTFSIEKEECLKISIIGNLFSKDKIIKKVISINDILKNTK